MPSSAFPTVACHLAVLCSQIEDRLQICFQGAVSPRLRKMLYRMLEKGLDEDAAPGGFCDHTNHTYSVPVRKSPGQGMTCLGEGEARALLLLQLRCSAIQTLQPREPQAPPRAFADGGAHSIWAPSCGSPQWYQRRTMQTRLGRAGGEEDAAQPAHLFISSALLGRRALPHPPQRTGKEISSLLRSG